MTLARMLAEARREGRQITGAVEPPADGYAVQDEVTRLLGWEVMGWKIAATTPVMQARLRMSEPIRGRSFRRFAVVPEARGAGFAPARFEHAELLDPLVEAEFFVILAEDAPVGARLADIRVARIQAGVEIAECRFPMAALPAPAAVIADGCANGRYVFGAEIPAGTDLTAMPVEVWVNGARRRTGTGADVMGHPLAAVEWLASHVALRAGEVISTGSATGMLPARAGDAMEVRFGGLEPIRLEFA